MIAQMAICAKEARERPDGLLDVIGAGITDIWATSYPAEAQFSVAIRLLLDEVEAKLWHELRVTLSLDGGPLPRIPPLPLKAVNVAVNRSTPMNCMVNLVVTLPHPGELVVGIAIDQVRIPQLRLIAHHGPPPKDQSAGAWTPV